MATKQVSDFPQITSIDGEDLLHVKTAGGVDNKIKVKDFILDEKLPRHFDTIALAKAEDDLQVGDYVRTGGYTSFNDGGGALYRVVAGGTGTDDGGSYHDMSNGNQLELVVEDNEFSLEVFGGGSSDYSTALANAETFAAANNYFIKLSEKTYIFDAVITLTRVKSDNATLKLKDSATVTGAISAYLVDIPANATIKGKLTVNGNKAGNAASPPTIGTVPGVGVRLNGGGHKIDHLRVINCWANGINYPLVNLGDVGNCKIGTIEVDNCAGGAYLNFQQKSGNIGHIKVTNMNAVYTGGNPHAVDLFFGEGVEIGHLEIETCDGSTAPSSAFYSGVTYIGWNDSTVKKTTIKDYQSTDLIPLAMSVLTAYRSKWYDLVIENWSQNRHIECIGMQHCTLKGGIVRGPYKSTFTGDSYTNTLGVIFTDSAVDNFNLGRDITSSNDNLLEDFVFENISTAIRDSGTRNRFVNVREYGGIVGYGTSNVSTEGGAYYNEGGLVGLGDAYIEGCEFSYNDNAGISANLSDLGSMTISNTKCNGNGIDTGAFINSRAGIRMDNADYRVTISNYDGRDLASENTGTLNISVPVITFAADELFELIHVDGTQKLKAGMRLTLTDAMGVGSHLTVRVEGNIKSRDKFGVRAISPASGTTNPNRIALTGTWSGTAGSRTITGSGGAARTEITGKQFIKVNTFTHIVAQVVDDNTIIIEDTLPANFSGQFMDRYLSSWTSTATQNRAYHGTYCTMKGVKWDGVIDSTNAASGVPMGNFEYVKTSSITTSETLNLNGKYTSILNMQGQATGSGNAAAYATVGFPATNQVTVYNQTGTARVFYVRVEE